MGMAPRVVNSRRDAATEAGEEAETDDEARKAGNRANNTCGSDASRDTMETSGVGSSAHRPGS